MPVSLFRRASRDEEADVDVAGQVKPRSRSVLVYAIPAMIFLAGVVHAALVFTDTPAGAEEGSGVLAQAELAGLLAFLYLVLTFGSFLGLRELFANRAAAAEAALNAPDPEPEPEPQAQPARFSRPAATPDPDEVSPWGPGLLDRAAAAHAEAVEAAKRDKPGLLAKAKRPRKQTTA